MDFYLFYERNLLLKTIRHKVWLYEYSKFIEFNIKNQSNINIKNFLTLEVSVRFLCTNDSIAE
jgi:hypothetical protein